MSKRNFFGQDIAKERKRRQQLSGQWQQRVQELRNQHKIDKFGEHRLG